MTDVREGIGSTQLYHLLEARGYGMEEAVTTPTGLDQAHGHAGGSETEKSSEEAR